MFTRETPETWGEKRRFRVLGPPSSKTLDKKRRYLRFLCCRSTASRDPGPSRSSRRYHTGATRRYVLFTEIPIRRPRVGSTRRRHDPTSIVLPRRQLPPARVPQIGGRCPGRTCGRRSEYLRRRRRRRRWQHWSSRQTGSASAATGRTRRRVPARTHRPRRSRRVLQSLDDYLRVWPPPARRDARVYPACVCVCVYCFFCISNIIIFVCRRFSVCLPRLSPGRPDSKTPKKRNRRSTRADRYPREINNFYARRRRRRRVGDSRGSV